jgi:hypothetical protein
MILNNVTKFPIVLIGPPRSGSIVTCRQVGYDLGIKHFFDLTYTKDQTEFNEFLDFAQYNDQYVIKFHSFDIKKYPDWLTNKIYNRSTYNVKIIRKNIISHVASVYIAEMRNLYHYDNNNLKDYSGPIEINYKRMITCISRCLSDIDELEKMPITFDTVIIYEEQQYNDELSTKTPLPSNYDKLLTEINRFIRYKKEI